MAAAPIDQMLHRYERQPVVANKAVSKKTKFGIWSGALARVGTLARNAVLAPQSLARLSVRPCRSSPRLSP